MNQFSYFLQDVSRIIGKKKYRLLLVIFTRTFWGLLVYRIERGNYLIFGRFYPIIRFPFTPLLMILQSFSNIDIHYKATIKGGMLILHPSVGIVVSGKAIIGKNLTLTGGNVIGLNGNSKNIDFRIGDNCVLGANATIIGPIVLGDHITIGASSCVVKNFPANNVILVGVPAVILNRE
ncbi:DapH/DapD/GlmU-related protein [Flavobacterium sp.]|uniref:serine O-acetyltransferase n=1 Tax=Flavobacterium sp. TaxID=239 RepID=UPI00261FE773|nr:DapH/DapD/GlmU-related protein [Flavobacterium sp.]